MNCWRRFGLLCLLGFVPWVVLSAPGGTTYVFPFGLLDGSSGRFLVLTTYLGALGGTVPAFARSLAIGAGCFLLALVSAFAGCLGFSTDQLTGGLLVLAALSQIGLLVGVGGRFHATAIPVGVLLVGFGGIVVFRGATRSGG
ncbi:hypothetical protein [Halocatena halophila]|uniref:hypothetical protein n=1 Tax=Halocatena halophila TaxID=2814576 RepID=UPI002ED673F9